MTLGYTSPEAITISMQASAVMATAGIAVKLSSTAGYVEIAGDGEQAIGILVTPALAIGDAVPICVFGRCKVKANGAFSIGDLLNSAASTGFVDTKGSTEHAIAVALEAATAQDDLVLALVKHVYV